MADSLLRQSSLFLLLLTMTGCAGLMDSHYEHSQQLRTEMAYLKFRWTCEQSCSSDYKSGWKAGYFDVVTGGDGIPPMFAPHDYWKPSQILNHGDQKRQEWYVGFQDGAMIASLQPDTHYLKVWAPTGACPPSETFPLGAGTQLYEAPPMPHDSTPDSIVPPEPTPISSEEHSNRPPAPELPTSIQPMLYLPMNSGWERSPK